MIEDNRMKKMPTSEQPYEKCLKNGASSLSDAELLAVILRSGAPGISALALAKKILYSKDPKDGLLKIHHQSLEELMMNKGIGKVKAVQILCISELSKRLSKANAVTGLSFCSPESVASYYMEEMRHLTQEQIKLIMLDSKNRFIGENNISKGTVNASLITPREIYIEALKKQAVSIIVLHNHPSGDPTASKEDIAITKRIKTVGTMIGIELVDHIIIGNNCYTSFRESQLI